MRELCRTYLAIALCFALITGQFAPPVRAFSSGAVAQSNTFSFILNPVDTAASVLRDQIRTAYSLSELVPPHRGNLRSNGSRTRTLRAQANGQSQSANLLGQSSTLLPNGRLLLLGGESKDGPVSSGFIKDFSSGQTTQLPTHLLHARAYHTATVLPDGSVFVFGGVIQGNGIEKSAEIFDPSSLKFRELPIARLTLRSYHSATLLTDGRVLIAGGVFEDGGVSGKIEFWDPRNQTVSPSSVEMLVPRMGQTATLRADGSVVFWGGFDKHGNPLTFGEVLDPSTQTTRIESSQPQGDGRSPLVEASIPQDGEQSVALDVVISVRFSKPLQVQSLNVNTVTLSGPDNNLVIAKVVPAEAGMLVFVTPQSALLPGTDYSLTISGPVDSAGQFLPGTAITFTTAGQAASGQAGIIGSGSQDNSDPLDSSWRKLPPLHAPASVTALAGQTLQLNGQPLSNVTIRIDQQVSRTDETGRFLVTGLVSGHHVMLIDGRSANRPGKDYGVFEVGVDLAAGITNVLGYTIWMTALDMGHVVTIPSPTVSETVVTTPLLPGLELHIPPGTVIRDSDGKTVTQISITQVPIDRPPFPLPRSVQVPIYFTIQPGAAYLETWGHGGARLIYPNTMGYLPGSKIQFWNYDADVKGWYVYGYGTVLPNMRSIFPEPSVEIYEFTGAMVGNQGNKPAKPAKAGGKKAGEPVDLATGLFTTAKTDLYVPDVIPLNLVRSYLVGDTVSRNFGLGSNDSFDIFIAGDTNPYTYMDLVLADGTTIHYPRISSGTGFVDAVYQHASTPTAFYGSTISWNSAVWNLKFKDGTVYTFPESSGSTTPNKAALTSIRDRFGNTVTFTRDSSTGNLTKVTSPHGRWISFTRDSNNRITQAQDNVGHSVAYSYDASGRLSTVTDPSGGVTTYTYDTSNRMLTIRDARNIVYLTNQYDASGRITQQTQGDNSVYQFSYISSGGVIIETDVTDPRGIVRTVTFNSVGYTLSDTQAFGLSEQRTTSYGLQAGSNLPTTITDALGRQTAYSYDSMGNVISVIRLAGTSISATTSLTYEPDFNQLSTITDPLNHTTTFSYDSLGSLIAITDALQHQATFTNSGGQLTSIRDPLGNTTHFSYDGGDLVSIADPLGNTTTRFIDNSGLLLASADALGHVTRYQYDQMNQLTALTDAQGSTTTFAYDPNGNLLSVADANNHTTQYTYDSMDRIATRKDPLLNQESYQYDGNGNLTQFTDRRSKVTTHSYDGLNRRTFTGFGTISGTPPTYESTVNFSYSSVACGNFQCYTMTATDSISGSITRTADALNHLITETTSQGTLSYGYDAAGRRITLTVPGQAAANYTYDNADRLIQIVQGNSTVTLGYDNANRRTILTLPDGIIANYGYDNASRLTGLTFVNGQATLGTLTYTYDQSGRRTNVGGTLASTILPNPVSITAYNANNQLTTWGTANLFYDLNGNMTSDGMHSYSWDARNQLSAIDSGATASFVYDSFGRRANKTIFGAQTGFLYDGANPVQELSGTTAIANSLMGGIDEVFQRTDSAGARSFLTDALGSTIALADSSGALQTQYSFEAFGNATITGSGTTNTFAYTGRELDGTGVYFYRARYYHPNLSRFLSEDPIGFNGGLNLYRYVSDDPLNLIDPFGSQSVAQPIPWYWILPFPAVSPWVFAIAGGIGLAIGQLVFPDATARDEDMLRKPLSRPYPKPPTTGRPICLQPPPFPGWDPTQPPTPDAEWRGRGPVGGPDGNWYDPTTGESYHPDLNHPDPIGPHWDWKDPSTGQWWRVFPNGPPALKP